MRSQRHSRLRGGLRRYRGGVLLDMKFDITIPNGRSGDWAVEDIEVTKQDSEFSAMRAIWKRNRDEFCPPGIFKRLVRKGHVVMSNTPMEIRTNEPIIRHSTGRVLINGLGLGIVLTAILRKPHVFEVNVIEKSEDVIKLVAPSFDKDSRVKIYHADAFLFQPPKGIRFNAVWHDIWDATCADNLPEMHRLHRKYGKRTDWQGSWNRAFCEQCR